MAVLAFACNKIQTGGWRGPVDGVRFDLCFAAPPNTIRPASVMSCLVLSWLCLPVLAGPVGCAWPCLILSRLVSGGYAANDLYVSTLVSLKRGATTRRGLVEQCADIFLWVVDALVKK